MFHPLISEWFENTFKRPTDIQQKAWPEIAGGKHVLITAPTGSGKTLTAFLWAINQLVIGAWEGGCTRVLYISPLKALNNDVRKNLREPLLSLKAFFQSKGEPFSDIHVFTRSGDTPQDERRRMIKRPPEILITTPESLNILVSSASGRHMLRGVRAVILDEIHAVISTKRGVHLMTAVDRMAPLCGEFQRIALSATIKPLDIVARFIGGYEMTGDVRDPVYEKRNVKLIQSDIEKKLDIRVGFPEGINEDEIGQSIWPPLVAAFKDIIRKNTSTLFFANSRRITEKVARLINEGEPDMLAYAHHGSLSREIRLTVEKKLKKGELKAIVATNSLELGIDIGNLDQVVLIQAPPAISSAIQRIGRSGHHVGGISKGIIFPTHGRDLIHAGVVAACVHERDIEDARPVENPLDILAQIILAMTGVETWDMDSLYSFIRATSAYHLLKQKHFDLVINMLAGKFADTRMKELTARVIIDRIDNTIQAKKGMLPMVYMAGGTIPDRGYYNLRLSDAKSKIGELDEEFVWERRVGETFSLGTQTWRIQKITPNDIEVVPATEKPGIIPFWRAEARNRDFHFSKKISQFLEYADPLIEKEKNQLKNYLVNAFFMEENAAFNLISFLNLQKTVTGKPLPHRHHLLVEHFDDALNQSDSKQVILHTIWGGRVNRPFAMALSAAIEDTFHYPVETFADDDAILLMLPHAFDTDMLLNLVTPDNIEFLLRKKLEKTGYFGASFRENAGRALLLPRAGFKKRMPLWLNRLRAKKLMNAVMATDDFPILVETFRSCLKDDFDLENLKILLDELATGTISVNHTITGHASPFSGNLIFQQTNKYMYEDDTPDSGKISNLPLDMLKDILGSMDGFGAISPTILNQLSQKLQRTYEGYAPGSPDDFLDWLRERLLIPEDEWETLLAAAERDHGVEKKDILKGIDHKLVCLCLPHASVPTMVAIENLPRIAFGFSIEKESLPIFPITGKKKNLSVKTLDALDKAFAMPIENEPEENEPFGILCTILGQWLSYYGPVEQHRITSIFGFSEADLDRLTESLIGMERIVFERFQKEGDFLVCDRDNLEMLLRMARKERRPSFKALSSDHLCLFVAAFQGLTEKGTTIEDLQDRMDQLFGFSMNAGSLEENILPARMSPYFPSFLDSLMQTSDLCWIGTGHKKITVAFKEEVDLFKIDHHLENKEEQNDLLPEKYGKYTFSDIASHTGLNTEDTALRVWDAVWDGRLTNDTFDVLRKGILNQFKPQVIQPSDRGRKSQFNRWKSSHPFTGNWYMPVTEGKDPDIIEASEMDKDRVRQLFRRYGILFREMLSKETSILSWGRLFKTLRLMELSGEILSGHFFEGIEGLQFISHEALRFLQSPLPEDAIYWMNATDPASFCGARLSEKFPNLPPRICTTHLVFHGKALVLVSKRHGKEVDIHVSEGHPLLHVYFSFFKGLVAREFNPLRFLRVEMINGVKADASPYKPVLKSFGFTSDYKGLELRKHF